jgi:hypothetical protein
MVDSLTLGHVRSQRLMNAQMRTAGGRHHIGTPCVVEQRQQEGVTAVLPVGLHYTIGRGAVASVADWLALALIFWHSRTRTLPVSRSNTTPIVLVCEIEKR